MQNKEQNEEMMVDKNPGDEVVNQNENIPNEESCCGCCGEEDGTEKDNLQCKLDELQCRFDELNDKYLRLNAEYDNYRKRSQKEKLSAYADAYSDAILLVLPIVDNVDRAAQFATDDSEMSKGIKMLATQCTEMLAKAGIEEIKTLGEQFDPNLHNAIMHSQDEETPANTVTQVFLKGYKKDDKVIRHSLVAVTN